MYLAHALFAWIQHYETSGVFPLTPSGAIWDVREHGAPPGFRVGLPSMWFTCKEAKDDLLRFIDGLNPGATVTDFFPEELAVYAIHSDADQLEEVCQNLMECIFYNGDFSNANDQALGIELCIFLDNAKDRAKPLLGDYIPLQGGRTHTRSVFIEHERRRSTMLGSSSMGSQRFLRHSNF